MKVNNTEVKHPKIFVQYTQWLGRCITEGRQLVSYRCPHCEATLNSGCPPVGDAWDSLANCPVCDGMFFKIIDNENGHPVAAIHTSPALN